MVRSARFIGEWKDHANGRLDEYVNNTLVGRWDDATADLTLPTNGLTVSAGGAAITGTVAVTGAATVSTTLVVTGLVTASAALTVTTGDLTVTAGDAHVVAQNLYLGAETAFGTTEPTSALIMKSGTAYAGAIVTSGAIQSTDTVLTKIIAAGTLNNIET